jgi:quinol monooxygenase YgiN
MTCTVLLEVRVKKEFVDGMAAGYKALFPDTRSFPGCIELFANQNQDDPQNFVIVETWESRAAYEKYFAWRVETGVIAAVNEQIEGELSLRYFDRIGA